MMDRQTASTSNEENQDNVPKKKLKAQDKRECEENNSEGNGVKWNSLEHNGPIFPPPYDSLPDHVKFYYDGTEMELSPDAEEVAGLYAKMLKDDYLEKDIFNKNFFKDWKESMTDIEKTTITDLKKCNFKPMYDHFANMAKLAKKAKKPKANKAAMNGVCEIDGHKEIIGNRIEPPGLFKGRGEHPKMGRLKKRVMYEDVIINCSEDYEPPLPEGRKWKKVQHNSNVAWLASWTENVQNTRRYIHLSPCSKLNQEKEKEKYETARKLHDHIDQIRNDYKEDWKSEEDLIKKQSVALYFIDTLLLRVGNEKGEDQAETFGCCSLLVKHIKLHSKSHDYKNKKDYIVVFDFIGKSSVRYYNEVPVPRQVYKNLKSFKEDKDPNEKLFDGLNANILNKYLSQFGLSAKVFRTYNASVKMQHLLKKTNEKDDDSEKISTYKNANKKVAKLCNHKKSGQNEQSDSESDLESDPQSDSESDPQSDSESDPQSDSESDPELDSETGSDNEISAISEMSSKLHYLDPRITFAWCKKFGIPIEQIYTKSQIKKFSWAKDTDETFVF